MTAQDDSKRRHEAMLKTALARALRPRASIRRSYLDNTELDALRKQLRDFEEARQQPKNLDFRYEAKDDILGMVRELDRTCPPRVVTLDPNGELLPSERGMRLSGQVQALEILQQQMRDAPDGASKKELQGRCSAEIDVIVHAISERRQAIQPKHPQIDPKRRHALAGVDAEKYIPFAREIAQAAVADRKTSGGQWLFNHLPAIDQMARHTQCSIAMLDLATAVRGVVNQCAPKGDHYWQVNREEFRRQLGIALDSFNAEIPENLRTDAAGKAYNRTITATKAIREAKSVDSLRGAAASLKNTALEYIMGSDEDHKLFTRVGQAYKRDKKAVALEERRYEEWVRSQDRDVSEFDNPLKHYCATMSLVYEARWALAADMVAQNLKDYQKTIADPAITKDAAPANEIHSIEPKGLVKRQQARRKPRTQPEGQGEDVPGHMASLAARKSTSGEKDR